jgi:hypothetical protein
MWRGGPESDASMKQRNPRKQSFFDLIRQFSAHIWPPATKIGVWERSMPSGKLRKMCSHSYSTNSLILCIKKTEFWLLQHRDSVRLSAHRHDIIQKSHRFRSDIWPDNEIWVWEKSKCHQEDQRKYTTVIIKSPIWTISTQITVSEFDPKVGDRWPFQKKSRGPDFIWKVDFLSAD